MDKAGHPVRGVSAAGMAVGRRELEDLYRRYNQRRYVHPDPLEFLYRYDDPLDREIAGLVASSLAYGRVAQILRAVSAVLDVMGPSPRNHLSEASQGSLLHDFAGIRHRFTSGEDIAVMLWGAKLAIKRYGSLQACFVAGYDERDDTVLPALIAFVDVLKCLAGIDESYLLPSPEKGSACKRLNLFLRWMVRSDAVDPGGWEGVRAAVLIVPLDTHMHRIGLALGLTQRRQADLRTAIEITGAFRTFAPDDPVRYDFALTRLGIRSDTDLEAFLAGAKAWTGDNASS